MVRRLLLLLISLRFSLFVGVHAQPVSRWGCGAGCAIEWTELSARKDVGDGWRKVLIRSQVLLWLPGESGWRKAKPHEWRGDVSDQFWLFAECTEGLLGSGASSDRSDAAIANIFNLEGGKKNTSAVGSVYEKWTFVCQ